MSDKAEASFPDEWDDEFFHSASKSKLNKNENGLFPENYDVKKGNSLESDNNPDISNDVYTLPEEIERKLAKKESVKEHKTRLNMIRQFVQAFNEISPLVDVASFNNKEDSSFKGEVTNLFTLQSFVVNSIKEEWNLDSENINDKYILSIVAKQVSNLIKDGFITSKNEKDKIDAILSCINEFIVERPYIGQLIDNNQLSEDILVNVKSALFPASLKFHKLLTGLEIEYSEIRRWIKWHHTLTVNLAKDLSFNWDKTSSFKDRERLFESSLVHCANIAQDVWEDNFSNGLDVKISALDDVSLWEHLSEFEKEVNDCDMGYLSHDIYGMDWLKKQVCEHILQKSNQLKSLDISNVDSYKLQLYFVDIYCRNSAEAWKMSSNKVIDEISLMLKEMTDEEQEKWMAQEGSKPMPLSRMYDALDEIIENNVFSKKINLDEMLLLKEAKGKLAMLWGLSDAVCKIKRKTSNV